jgi:hypothetical protein
MVIGRVGQSWLDAGAGHVNGLAKASAQKSPVVATRGMAFLPSGTGFSFELMQASRTCGMRSRAVRRLVVHCHRRMER